MATLKQELQMSLVVLLCLGQWWYPGYFFYPVYYDKTIQKCDIFSSISSKIGVLLNLVLEDDEL